MTAISIFLKRLTIGELMLQPVYPILFAIRRKIPDIAHDRNRRGPGGQAPMLSTP
jgi:hypothetical protein